MGAGGGVLYMSWHTHSQSETAAVQWCVFSGVQHRHWIHPDYLKNTKSGLSPASPLISASYSKKPKGGPASLFVYSKKSSLGQHPFFIVRKPG